MLRRRTEQQPDQKTERCQRFGIPQRVQNRFDHRPPFPARVAPKDEGRRGRAP